MIGIEIKESYTPMVCDDAESGERLRTTVLCVTHQKDWPVPWWSISGPVECSINKEKSHSRSRFSFCMKGGEGAFGRIGAGCFFLGLLSSDVRPRVTVRFHRGSDSPVVYLNREAARKAHYSRCGNIRVRTLPRKHACGMLVYGIPLHFTLLCIS